MAGFYYITIANGLLEPKHVEAMGEAVWLYMWLQDKNTSINENGEGKVLGNKPITYFDVKGDLGISRPTYQRWVEKLRDAGYINTIRTPHGLIVTITKAKKASKRSIKSEHHSAKKAESDVSKMDSDVSKSSTEVSKSNIQYKTNKGTNKRTNKINTTNVVLDKSDEIGVLYYQVIRKLKLPIRNHNNVKTNIKKMQLEKQHIANINYLNFMLNQFEDAVFAFKPDINEALDIYTKRNQIINNIKRASSQKTKGGFYKV